MPGDELDAFINEILETKKLSGVNDEVRTQLVTDMKERLLDQINRAIIEAIPEEKLDEFNTLLDQPDLSDDVVQQFIIDSSIDTQKVAAGTMLRFRDLYLQGSQEREA